MTILIIGAGIAGAAAAHDLKQAGQAVTILEARDRVGGRIFTRRDVAPGVPVEMGAEFIHGEHAPQWDLVHDLNLRTLHWQKQDDSLVRLESGEMVTMKTARQNPDFDITRTWNLPDVPVRAEDEDLYYYLSRIGFSKEQLQYTRRSYINATGDAIHHVSARAALEEMREDSLGTEDHRIMDGYDHLVERLLAGIEVQRNTIVGHIAWGPQGVTVTTDQGQFDADKVILTVPVGVLQQQHILFEPPLPTEKAAAIDALAMGPGMKLIYVFDRPVLPEGIIALYSRHNPPMWWSPSFGHAEAKQHVMTALATGDWARELTALGDAGMLDRGLQTLRTELADYGPVPDPLAMHIQNWTDDPYAFGVYSVVPPGAADKRAVLAQPVGDQLYWAGEATASNATASTVHGAYVSGKRAAQEVLASLR